MIKIRSQDSLVVAFYVIPTSRRSCFKDKDLSLLKSNSLTDLGARGTNYSKGNCTKGNLWKAIKIWPLSIKYANSQMILQFKSSIVAIWRSETFVNTSWKCDNVLWFRFAEDAGISPQHICQQFVLVHRFPSHILAFFYPKDRFNDNVTLTAFKGYIYTF